MTASKLSKRIRQSRIDRNLSMARFAEQSGISKTYLWELENHEDPHPSVDVVQRIASAMGLSIDELLQEEDDTVSVKDRIGKSLRRIDSEMAKIRKLLRSV